ncbi:MAG: hypothetical protein AUG04_00680 [Deltaproteobacteria bacterium 13_1_20CM_2_69_21]|nr:MAG: hypothetical protein AUI48_05700 [Chloroflexi bacterium 13_1_40CM_2_68_14]OLE64383.1 MAG: hypothetical protein AUG04_00680 [Deltaproteobacteria bacterium 13_1_20CM_2_69_21]
MFACFPNAVRVFFGILEIVLFLRAALAAFLMFRRAAVRCREVATHRPCAGARGSGYLRDRDAYTSAPSARAMRIRRP